MRIAPEWSREVLRTISHRPVDWAFEKMFGIPPKEHWCWHCEAVAFILAIQAYAIAAILLYALMRFVVTGQIGAK